MSNQDLQELLIEKIRRTNDTEEIVWSKRALTDRRQIPEYWIDKNKSSKFSEKLDKLFLQKIEFFSFHPFIGKKTTFKSVRIKIVLRYLIY